MTCQNTLCQCCDDVPILEEEIAAFRARVAELEAALRGSLDALDAVRSLAQEIRNGWSTFDGRAHRNFVMALTDSAVDAARAALSGAAQPRGEP